MTLDEQMLVSAVRYALGRATYIVHSTCAATRSSWPGLSLSARAVILRDIREALDAASINGTTVGMDFDHREWVKLLEAIVTGALNSPTPLPQDDSALGPDDGYPSEEELLRLAAFRGTPRELIEYTESIWRNGAGVTVERIVNSWGREEVVATFVTGGWSGCEQVIGVLSRTLALMYTSSWQRGGLHSFSFPGSVYDSDASWDWAFPTDGTLPDRGPFTEVRDRLAVMEAAAGHHPSNEIRENLARALYSGQPSMDNRHQPKPFEAAEPHFRDLSYRQADLALLSLVRS